MGIYSLVYFRKKRNTYPKLLCFQNIGCQSLKKIEKNTWKFQKLEKFRDILFKFVCV